MSPPSVFAIMVRLFHLVFSRAASHSAIVQCRSCIRGYYRSTGLRRILKGVRSQIKKALKLSCQVSPGFSSSKSKFQSILARMSRISAHARLSSIVKVWTIQEKQEQTYAFPRHPLGPYEKGWITSFWSFLNYVAPSGSHRSGRNSSGREKLPSYLDAA